MRILLRPWRALIGWLTANDINKVPRCTDCGQPVGPDAVAVNGHLYHPYFCVEYRDAA